MLLTNEKGKHNFDNNFVSVAPPVYSYADIQPYGWYPQIIRLDWPAFNEWAPQIQHNLNINGGTDKISYFFNFGYQKQDGVFKSDDMDYNKYNFRSNVTMNIAKGLNRAGIGKSGWMDEKNQPYQDLWTIFKYAWNQIPRNQIYANDNPLYPAV
jgi:hypothetical protein